MKQKRASPQAERREAEHAAWAAPGVVSVTNEITISP
jgi:osmotically-inducible protein OsmY